MYSSLKENPREGELEIAAVVWRRREKRGSQPCGGKHEEPRSVRGNVLRAGMERRKAAVALFWVIQEADSRNCNCIAVAQQATV